MRERGFPAVSLLEMRTVSAKAVWDWVMAWFSVVVEVLLYN